MTGEDRQRIRALFPPPPRTTLRGIALDHCLYLRGLRSWVTRGCYGWWRLTDDLRTAQRALLVLRRERLTGDLLTAQRALLVLRRERVP